jgi:hypothetical protein
LNAQVIDIDADHDLPLVKDAGRPAGASRRQAAAGMWPA